MNIIFKTIKTPNNYYVYDRSRNSILGITQEEYNELKSVENGILDPTECQTIKKKQDKGFFRENNLRSIQHSCTNVLDHYLTHHIEQVILQVTQRCNLRCKYCVYSGDYNNRGHANIDMSFETAKKILDFYLASSVEVEQPVIGFYGGEPLLKIDLIKQCIDYVKDKAPGRKVKYIMTTNATLLTVPIAEYLYKNDFSLTISLDGSKKEHDEYRVFENNTGSFDTIIKNLKAVINEIPEFPIQFNCVYNPKHNYRDVKKYFEYGDIIADARVGLNTVMPKSSDEAISFSDEFYQIRTYDYFKFMLYMIGKLDEKYISKLVLDKKSYITNTYNMISKNNVLGEVAHHGGPCIAGARRLFINAEGNFYPCERVSETSPVMLIGNVNEGFYFEKARDLLNVGKVTEDHCKKCWAFLHCDQCASKADGGTHLSKTEKLKHCSNSRNRAFSDLMELCVLKEMGCDFEEEDFDE